jgi:hypothetical protein
MSKFGQLYFRLFQRVMLGFSGFFLIKRIEINAFRQGSRAELLTHEGQSSVQIASIRTGCFSDRRKQYLGKQSTVFAPCSNLSPIRRLHRNCRWNRQVTVGVWINRKQHQNVHVTTQNNPRAKDCSQSVKSGVSPPVGKSAAAADQPKRS